MFVGSAHLSSKVEKSISIEEDKLADLQLIFTGANSLLVDSSRLTLTSIIILAPENFKGILKDLVGNVLTFNACPIDLI